MHKIPYDDYFLTLAYVVAQRSLDPSTKCGAVLVSEDKKILSTGYNGPLKNSDDSQVPLTRPEKYAHFLHAEENCILSFFGSKADLIGSTMYVTGNPCHKCMRMIIQKGITNIVYADSTPAVMHDDVEASYCNTMLAYGPAVNVLKVPNLQKIVKVLNDTAEYIKIKNPEKVSTSE